MANSYRQLPCSHGRPIIDRNHSQYTVFSLVPYQHIMLDVVHHLAFRPGGEVKVKVYAL